MSDLPALRETLGGGAARALLRDAADDAVIGHQLAHHLSGHDALRAMGDTNVRILIGIAVVVGEDEVGPGFLQP